MTEMYLLYLHPFTLIKRIKLKSFSTHAIHPHQFTSFPLLICSAQTFTQKFSSKVHQTSCAYTFLCKFMKINLSNYFAILNDAEQNFSRAVCSKSKNNTLFRLFKKFSNFSFLQPAFIFKTLFLVWSYSEQRAIGHS